MSQCAFVGVESALVVAHVFIEQGWDIWSVNYPRASRRHIFTDALPGRLIQLRQKPLPLHLCINRRRTAANLGIVASVLHSQESGRRWMRNDRHASCGAATKKVGSDEGQAPGLVWCLSTAKCSKTGFVGLYGCRIYL